MSHGSARCFAAALRGFGFNALPFPPSDARTLELGSRHATGEECYPGRLTLGDALKIVLDSGEAPEKIAIFMPSAPGPCRFGQYAPFLRRVLDEVGATATMVLSPSSRSGYDELGRDSQSVQRACWRALVAADTLRRALLRLRPYETQKGRAQEAYERGIAEAEEVLERTSASASRCLKELHESQRRSAERFGSIPREDAPRPLIGIVGEIYCRLNTFSNEEVVRLIEELGGEAWISDISEWVYYTNQEQRRKWLPYAGKSLSREMAAAWIKDVVQRRDEAAIAGPFHDLLRDRAEPRRVSVVTDLAEPYLPSGGVYGEMVLNVGKAVWLWSQGCHGIIDISPFTCMNGIVCEAIYPRLSRDHDGIPIRILYFDGTSPHLARDVGIFLELAQTYRRRRRAHPQPGSPSLDPVNRADGRPEPDQPGRRAVSVAPAPTASCDTPPPAPGHDRGDAAARPGSRRDHA